MKQLVENLIRTGILKTPKIIDAFYEVDRIDFVLQEARRKAYFDRPLPIGFGQTISQPLVVAFMIELLQPQEGEKILDIGFGSGWQSCLLAKIVGGRGQVFAIERIPEIYKFGQQNCEKYIYQNIKLILGNGSRGYEKEAPYDKIIVAAAAFREVPTKLEQQLAKGGRLVIPVDNSIWLIEKKGKDKFIRREFPGFAFVPLIENG
ncbi:protein-L-isoaspartate(D-aspartate) O-methyltransferase [Patescibacteria group bacterium]|nr:protein-L-isoaspartate(D-aspartate) O-methyltransferase [Patescibacteria group bacterium]